MFYLKWFETLSKLVSPAPGGPRLRDETQQRSLLFLGNMLMPAETHIIRMLAGTPQTFDSQTPHLSSKPELYSSGFFLPGEGVVVEDQYSAVGLVDLDRSGPRTGLQVPRVFIAIEEVHAAPPPGSFQSIGGLLSALSLAASTPEGTFATVWGVIHEVVDLNVERRPVKIGLAPWGVMLFNGTGVLEHCVSPWFHESMIRGVQSSDAGFGPELTRLLQSGAGTALVQNLQCAMLQIAYHNAIKQGKQ